MRPAWLCRGPTIMSLGVGMGAFALFVGGKAVAAQRLGTTTGSEGLIGAMATVRMPFAEDGKGKVLIAGELWNARLRGASSADASTPVAGEQVKVEAREGYILIVSPQEEGLGAANQLSERISKNTESYVSDCFSGSTNGPIECAASIWAAALIIT